MFGGVVAAALVVGLVQTPDPATPSTRLSMAEPYVAPGEIEWRRFGLQNGAQVIVQRFPESREISVQIWVNSVDAAETPETHGRRHLLEHLLARGPEGYDRQIESLGLFTTAETTRDTMQFEVRGPADRLAAAVQALRPIVTPPRPTAEDIAREIEIMREESALRPRSRLLSERLWRAAFGDAGLDPFGNLDQMASATPETLSELHRTLFVGGNLLVTVAGPMSIDEGRRLGASLVEHLPRREPGRRGTRREFPEGDASWQVQEARGAARGIAVGPFTQPSTAHALAAAFAVASEVPAPFVIHTPSRQPGLVIVGSVDAPDDFARFFAAGSAASRSVLFETGRALAREWANRWRTSPSGANTLRGRLAVQGAGPGLEIFLHNLDAMTADEFEAAMDRFYAARTAAGGNR
ncbi:MAG: insulinase family protein [Fimbriimonadaceae bacterium]